MDHASTDSDIDCALAIHCLNDVLAKTGAFIDGLPDDDVYTTSPDGWGGTIGAHVRHCWDHVAALVEGLATGVIAYDHRCRGTAVESERAAASAQLREFAAGLARCAETDARQPLAVEAMLACDRPAQALPSTLARELGFVLSHTIHHQAMMAMIATRLGLPVPEGFGYAPATVAYLQQQSR